MKFYMLLNQKTVNRSRTLRKLQKRAKKLYGKPFRVEPKNYFGKLSEQIPDDVVPRFPRAEIVPCDREAFMARLQEMNLLGMSGTGFPVHQKISTFLENKGEDSYLLVNSVECELGLVHDEWLLDAYLDEILETVRFLKECLGIGQCFVGVKKWQDKYAAIPEMRHVAAIYPMGEEHQLIKHILGRTYAKSEIPATKGILVMNLQSVYQIYRVLSNTYDGGRYTTVANFNTGRASVNYIPAGQTVGQTVELNRRKLGLKGELFAGQGIFEILAASPDDPVTAKTSFIGCGTPAPISNAKRCNGCGRCDSACPMGVSIMELVRRREDDPTADISDLGIHKCIFCNSCMFVCPEEKDLNAYKH